ncbi:MAG: lysostaphin resistance A-like protein [Haloarculaceae archaeon]
MADLYRPADLDVRLRAVAHGLGMIAGAFVVALLLVTLAGQALALVGVDLQPNGVGTYVVSAVLQFAGFVAAALGYLWYRDDFSLVWFRQPTLRDAGWAVLALVGLFVVNFSVGVVSTLLGAESAQNAVVEAGRAHPALFLYMIPITVFLVAPGEELVFRGVVQGWFRRAFGVVPAIVGASLLFGVVHAGALVGGGKLVYIAGAVLLGLVLGAVYEHTENVLVSIAAHGLWNTFLFVVNYLVATGAIAAHS